jgi:hypothetical protein
VQISEPVDTFLGAGGEANARSFEVLGYSFLARKPLAVQDGEAAR